MAVQTEIDLIAAELEKVSATTEYGPLAVEIAAAFASGVPFVGPPLGVLLKKVGDKQVGPDLKEMLTRTVWEIQQIVPEIEKIGGLHERVRVLESRRDDDKLADLLRRAADELIRAADDAVRLNTVGSELSARNVTVDGREFSSSASFGGFVDLSGLRQSGGPATIATTGGSKQVLDGASFSKADNQAVTSTQMGKGVSHIGGRTAYNVRQPGMVAAVHHTSTGENGFGMMITVGPNGPEFIFG